MLKRNICRRECSSQSQGLPGIGDRGTRPKNNLRMHCLSEAMIFKSQSSAAGASTHGFGDDSCHCYLKRVFVGSCLIRMVRIIFHDRWTVPRKREKETRNSNSSGATGISFGHLVRCSGPLPRPRAWLGDTYIGTFGFGRSSHCLKRVQPKGSSARSCQEMTLCISQKEGFR